MRSSPPNSHIDDMRLLHAFLSYLSDISGELHFQSSWFDVLSSLHSLLELRVYILHYLLISNSGHRNIYLILDLSGNSPTYRLMEVYMVLDHIHFQPCSIHMVRSYQYPDMFITHIQIKSISKYVQYTWLDHINVQICPIYTFNSYSFSNMFETHDQFNSFLTMLYAHSHISSITKYRAIRIFKSSPSLNIVYHAYSDQVHQVIEVFQPS